MKFYLHRIYLFVMLGCIISSHINAQSIQVFFTHNSSDISIQDITKIEETVKSNPMAKWELEAKTSSSGNEEYNLHLSLLRANKVNDKLKSLGIKEENIKLAYVGERKSKQTFDDANDRVVTVTFKNDKAPLTEKPPTTTRLYTVTVSIWDALEKKTLQGTYIQGNDEKKYPYSDSIAYNLAENKIQSITFSAAGYRDSTILINTKSAHLRVELFPQNVLEKLIVENIYFFPNSAEIIPESFRALDELYAQLKTKKDIKIEIRGHINWPIYMGTSPDLDEEHQDLSERRAKAVMNWLIKKGIPAEMLSFKGLSNSQMLYPEASTEGQMAYNRRVEVIILKK